MKRLRDAHPGLEIESCSSGGARSDYGVLRYADRIWPSDSNDALDRQQIQRGASYFFPLCVTGTHVGPRECHITRRTLSMAFRAATAFFGHMGLELDLMRESDEDLEILKEAVSLHKKHRRLLHEGDFVRLDSSDYLNVVGVVANGAVIFAREAGYLDGGADIYVESSIPDGAGLSSSAALIVAILKAARDHNGAAASDEEIAKLARRVENDYIGVPCGIMDQMAVAVAREGQAIALDTISLAYDVIDLPSDYRMAVIHSGQFRKLSESKYAERKHECDKAKAALGAPELCLLTDDGLKKAETLPDPIYRRVRHCVTEHRRVKAAADALRASDIPVFGMLMNESHLSMRDDFEMSTPMIDALVESAVRLGAVGARLTGGGFGGCIVVCVEAGRHDEWISALLKAHGAAQPAA